MMFTDEGRRPESNVQRTAPGWTSLHSWIFLGIVFLGVVLMASQNRYHYLSPLGLGKAYRIDKVFGSIQEFEPNQGWITAQLQPLPTQPPMSMMGPGPEASQAVPMNMPGQLPASPPAVGMGVPSRPVEKEEPTVSAKEAPSKPTSTQAARAKEARELSPEERFKSFKRSFPDFGADEFQFANDDLYPDWKKNVSPKGTWSEFLGVYKDFVQWWENQGQPANVTGDQLWKQFLASRNRR
jgi:hypothetical protein